jgi:hypothetical protein
MRKPGIKRGKIGRKAIQNMPKFDQIADDDARRLRNAMRVLAELDPHFLWWLERNIPQNMPLRIARIHTERQARVLLGNKYGHLGKSAWLGIVYGDFYFTDSGNLKLYL